eukprot:IDg16364t1
MQICKAAVRCVRFTMLDFVHACCRTPTELGSRMGRSLPHCIHLCNVASTTSKSHPNAESHSLSTMASYPVSASPLDSSTSHLNTESNSPPALATHPVSASQMGFHQARQQNPSRAVSQTRLTKPLYKAKGRSKPTNLAIQRDPQQLSNHDDHGHSEAWDLISRSESIEKRVTMSDDKANKGRKHQLSH